MQDSFTVFAPLNHVSSSVVRKSAMASSYNSNVTSFDSYNTDERNAQTRTDWSFAWEFDWSPAGTTTTDTPRTSQNRSGADKLGHMLDRALAYAG